MNLEKGIEKTRAEKIIFSPRFPSITIYSDISQSFDANHKEFSQFAPLTLTYFSYPN